MLFWERAPNIAFTLTINTLEETPLLYVFGAPTATSKHKNSGTPAGMRYTLRRSSGRRRMRLPVA